MSLGARAKEHTNYITDKDLHNTRFILNSPFCNTLAQYLSVYNVTKGS